MHKTNWWLPLGLFLVGTISWLIIPMNIALMTMDSGTEIGGQWLGVYTFFLLVMAVSYMWLYIWIILETAHIAGAIGQSIAAFVIFAIFLPVIALIVVLVMQASRTPAVSSP